MKIKFPDAAGGHWIQYGKPVKVLDDGTVVADQETIRMLAEKLPHCVEVIEGDGSATDEPAEAVEGDSVPTVEEVMAAGYDAETAKDIVAEEEAKVEPLDDVALRALAKEHDVKLGRIKSRDKIVAKLQAAGVDVPGE
jgi:hypothetical protein